MPELSELLSPGEAARRLGVSVKWLSKWADEGKLTVERSEGGHRRYTEASVEALVAERRRAAQ